MALKVVGWHHGWQDGTRPNRMQASAPRRTFPSACHMTATATQLHSTPSSPSSSSMAMLTADTLSSARASRPVSPSR